MTHELPEQATAYPQVQIHAHQTGSEDWFGLRSVRVVVTDALVSKLRALSALAKEHDLSEVRVSMGPEQWEPGEIEDAATLENEELVVAGGAFWFRAGIKHSNDDCESMFLLIDQFLDDVAEGQRTFGECSDDEQDEDED